MKTKTLVNIALLAGFHVVLSRFLSINAWNIKIGFAFFPVFLAAYLYGPLAAGAVGALGDFAGALLFPIGPYFPGFTLTCGLSGVVYGLLLHKKQTLPRVLAAVGINVIALGLFFNSFWISVLYGAPYLGLLSVRVVQAAVLFVAESVVISFAGKTAGARLSGVRGA